MQIITNKQGNIENVIEEAIREATSLNYFSYSPYSKFKVSSVVVVKLSESTWVISGGVNVENASYGLSQCAERNAICGLIGNSKELTNKLIDMKIPEFTSPQRIFDLSKCPIEAVVVYTPTSIHTTPCGACRQFINEFSHENTKIISVNRQEEIKTFKMKDLLPASFGPLNL